MPLDPPDDAVYRETLLAPLRTCAQYKPNMGKNSSVDLQEFHILYAADPFYHWIGLDSSLMYAAHKAAGGMTSIYRQLGIGCERLFRQILQDKLGLNSSQVTWSYEKVQGGRKQKLALDGRIQVSEVVGTAEAARIAAWIEEQKRLLGIKVTLTGAVFEVRQGYKSADSKRQNADLANASQAISDGYLPVLTIMSTQINEIVKTRYQVGKWAVLLGTVGTDNPFDSTFDFMRDVVGYDLEQFFVRNHETLRSETEVVLKNLLAAT